LRRASNPRFLRSSADAQESPGVSVLEELQRLHAKSSPAWDPIIAKLAVESRPTVSITAAAIIANVNKGNMSRDWLRLWPELKSPGKRVYLDTLIALVLQRKESKSRKTARKAKQVDQARTHASTEDVDDRASRLHDVMSKFVLRNNRVARNRVIAHVGAVLPGTPDEEVDRELSDTEVYRLVRNEDGAEFFEISDE
jgi:hypothetical protein